MNPNRLIQGITAAVIVMTALLSIAPSASARPLPTDRHVIARSGSCARVVASARHACRFPKHHLDLHRRHGGKRASR